MGNDLKATPVVDNWRLQQHIVRDQGCLSPNARYVALVIALHRNSFTLKCCPSLRVLELETGLTRKTVHRAVMELERKGVLLVERGTRGPRGRPANHYAFTFDAHEVLEAGDDCRALNPDSPEYDLLCRLP
jgi:hypothetical protein